MAIYRPRGERFSDEMSGSGQRRESRTRPITLTRKRARMSLACSQVSVLWGERMLGSGAVITPVAWAQAIADRVAGRICP